jgi:hypothetical protein
MSNGKHLAKSIGKAYRRNRRRKNTGSTFLAKTVNVYKYDW